MLIMASRECVYSSMPCFNEPPTSPIAERMDPSLAVTMFPALFFIRAMEMLLFTELLQLR